MIYDEENEEDFSYYKSIITGYKGTNQNIKIPHVFKSISSAAFKNNTNIESIVIPNSINSIGKEAFSGCKNLKYIKIGNGIKKIEEDLFKNCINLNVIYLGKNISSGIKKITFKDCKNLLQIIIDPENVTYKFENNILFKNFEDKDIIFVTADIKLKDDTFVIPNYISSFDISILKNCKNIKQLYIPSSLRSFENSDFEGPENLEKIIVDENNYKYTSLEGVLYDKNLKNLIYVPRGKEGSIVVDNRCEKLVSGSFAYCKKITDVDLSENLEIIDKEAFLYCENLTNIDIPESVINIEMNSFSYCSKLKSIKISDNVTNLGASAFSYCVELNYIFLGNGIKILNDSCFYSCKNLYSIDLPKNLKEIKSNVFYDCRNLFNIAFPRTLDIIGNNAFYGCNPNEHWIFCNNDYKISLNAFGNNKDSVVNMILSIFPSQIDSSIFKVALKKVIYLLTRKKVYWESWRTEWRNSVIDNLSELYDEFTSDTLLFIAAIKAKCFTVDAVEKFAFKLFNLGIPESFHILRKYYESLENHNKLFFEKFSSITFLRDLWSLKKRPEDGQYVILNYRANNIHVEVPSYINNKGPLRYIGPGAFSPTVCKRVTDEQKEIRRKIESITIPETIISIGHNAFTDCKSLRKVKIVGNLEFLGPNVFGNIYDNIELLILPKKIDHEELYKDIFFKFTSLKSVVLPEGITTIPDYAFNLYENLEYLYIPSTVTEIGKEILSCSHKIKLIVISKENKEYYVEDDCIRKKDKKTFIYIPIKSISKFTLDTSRLTEKIVQNDVSYVEFGDWPQSLKKDNVMIDGSQYYMMGHLKCFKGNDGNYYVKEKARPYIYKFHGTYYNPCFDNGKIIEKGKYYYFKVESIKWRVLEDNKRIGKLVMSDKILFSRAFDTHGESLRGGLRFNLNTETDIGRGEGIYLDDIQYMHPKLIKEWFLTTKNSVRLRSDDTIVHANNYEYSDIRAYLNGYDGRKYLVENYFGNGFLYTAFTPVARAKIKMTNVYNYLKPPLGNRSPFEDGQGSKRYVADDTCDKIFLFRGSSLIKKSRGFADYSRYLGDIFDTKYTGRDLLTTDYARATGAFVYAGKEALNKGWWWQRLPDFFTSGGVKVIGPTGAFEQYPQKVYQSEGGVVMGMTIKETEKVEKKK